MIVNLIYNELIQKFEGSYPFTDVKNPLVTENGIQTLTNKTITGGVFTGGSFSGGITLTSGQFLAPDGTAALPAYSFASDPNTGIYRFIEGSFATSSNGSIGVVFSSVVPGGMLLANDTAFQRAAVGNISIGLTTSVGARFKADALPTIASGFGTGPAVTAGSTPLAGSVDVGTGGIAVTGVILFNGTAFPSAPFVTVTCSAGAVPTTVVATTTQITLTTSVAWPASTIVNWHCISAK